MNSRIILNSADFSKNNIGRYTDLNDFTKKILAKQKQYREDSNEAVALNDFVEYLLDYQYIGVSSPKFKVLIIPALASEHDELLFNLAAVDGNGYPIDAMRTGEKSSANPVLFPIKDSMSRVVALGSKTPNGMELSEWLELTAIVHGDNLVPTEPMPSRSLFAYNTNDVSTQVLDINGILDIQRSRIGGQYNAVSYGYSANSIKGFVSASYNENGYIYEAMVSKDIELTLLSGGTTSASKVKVYNSSSSPAELLKIVPRHYTESSHTKPALIGYSEYLSPTEMEELKEKVERLMRALHVVDYKDSL